LGILNSKAILVHMTQITNEDLALVEKTGAHVVHCPKSNLKLANGFCPVAQFQKRGINVALGTDSAVSNNNLDMIEETRTAALIAKAITNDPCALKAPEALAMATINGAHALGLDAEIGSLEIGKAADIISINLETLSASPVYDPIAQIVYASHANDITNVWVAGKQLLANGRLTTLDEASILQKTKDWSQRIKK
jgi:5-methylthioadenosine/S-adenosylhomocysteine deaminase